MSQCAPVQRPTAGQRSGSEDGDGERELPCHYLHAGQTFVSRQRCSASTVLGSCVSVCLWDPILRAGGMNHYLLPDLPRAQASARLGSVAIPMLISRLVAVGSATGDLLAKVFGGASILSVSQNSELPKLGAQNVALAHRLLRDARIPVVDEEVGGRRARTLTFRMWDGATSVRLL